MVYLLFRVARLLWYIRYLRKGVLLFYGNGYHESQPCHMSRGTKVHVTRSSDAFPI